MPATAERVWIAIREHQRRHSLWSRRGPKRFRAKWIPVRVKKNASKQRT